MKFIIKILIYLVLFAIMGFLLIYLFFQEEFNDFRRNYLGDIFPLESEQENISDLTLKIAYATNYESLDPVLSNPETRARTLNIYEALVKTDRNLQAQPALALSWGRLDDVTWEFNLRPNVKFHDGSIFESGDVISSFNRALNNPNSDLKDKLNTISKIEKIDDLTLKISTKDPDPILVNRIASVLIFPSEKTNFDNPIGTAAYKYSAKKDNEIALERFEDYWGNLPFYKYVLIQSIENRFSRIDAIKNGDIHILANVPPSFAEELEEKNSVQVVAIPSLEVNFLIFNLNSNLLKDKRIREALTFTFDKSAFVEFSAGYASPSNQFVSNGIYGFNPDIEYKTQDLEKAKTIVKDYDPFKRPSISVDMVIGAESIGEFIKYQLNEIGISSTINYLPFETLRQKIFDKESEMYLLGWRSEMGDASGFYENVVHSDGKFNGGDFSSKKVDQLINLSLTNLDPEKRLDQFHEIMKIITDEEIIGVPLFEADIIYGIRVGIHFHPRLDGYILASEISKI